MFDNFNVNLRKNKGFLTYIPYIPIPEYGQSLLRDKNFHCYPRCIWIFYHNALHTHYRGLRCI